MPWVSFPPFMRYVAQHDRGANFDPVKNVMYPKLNSCRPFYDKFRNPNGGYGGLLSATFHKRDDAVTFFDALETAKGPSLGTNFTLRSVATRPAQICR